MLCVLPVCAGDVYLLFDLLKWMKQLGGTKGHAALIVADAGLSWPLAEQAIFLALECFEDVQFLPNAESVSGWVAGSNSLWATAAKACKDRNIDGWLWMESDAIPLKASWLDDLYLQWQVSGSPFLGAAYHCDRADCPPMMMSGIAVYPFNAIDYFRPVAEAFDVQLSRQVILKLKPTGLIQHFWGDQTGLPPTFRETKVSTHPHVFTLASLTPDAVVFHRNKDGTLVDLLRKKAGVPVPPRMLVVLPVCEKDAALMVKCLDWMYELDGKNNFDCVLSYDHTLGPSWLSRLRNSARRAFQIEHEFSYPIPPRAGWPEACNFAFKSTAAHMQAFFKRPWFWFEADCVPLKPNWLDRLWLEYQNCLHPIMGPVIRNMGHMNGTAIYPSNFASISPGAMRYSKYAWDTQMTYDIVGKVHNCDRLFHHRWGMMDGGLHDNAGPPPHFSSREAVDQWIPREAVVFHRCKDGSLIDQLRAKKRT